MSRNRLWLVAASFALTVSGCSEAGSPVVRRYVEAVLANDFDTANSNICLKSRSLLGESPGEMDRNLRLLLAEQHLAGDVSVDFKRGDSKYGIFVLNGDERQRKATLRTENGIPCPEGSLLGKMSSW